MEFCQGSESTQVYTLQWIHTDLLRLQRSIGATRQYVSPRPSDIPHDVFRKYGYLTFPHDVSRTSMEAVKHHRHFAFWQMKGIRWVQRWLGEYKPPENTSDDSPTGTCEVQVVRSSSRWSHGIQTEHSIQNACM